MSRFRFALPIVLSVVALFIGCLWLRSYTRHSTVSIVPDLTGLNVVDAQQALADRDMVAMVIDSVYNDQAVKGGVVSQDPLAGAEVKPGRKVYLVLNAQRPPMIDMPDLVDLSKRQALSVMEILGLKVSGLEYRPDPCVDCGIEQRIDGDRVAAGTRVRRGSSIALVLGSGDQGERVPVPDLRGLTFAEVGAVLNMASLNQGVLVSCEGCNTSVDSTFARVFRQSPGAGGFDRIAMGSSIDVWLTMDTVGLAPVSGWNDPVHFEPNETNDTIH
ncbi:MAG: PASTA domain-containing protein [Flavobacteriales bacterium]|nr:PASTA domain-containing protein [Flavobacteriales bacterium]